MVSAIKQYLWNWLVWADEGVATLLLRSPNETVSEVAAKARNNGKRWGCIVCRILDAIKKGHCDASLKETIGNDAIIPDGD